MPPMYVQTQIFDKTVKAAFKWKLQCLVNLIFECTKISAGNQRVQIYDVMIKE